MSKVRAFIAVELPLDVVRKLVRLQDTLRGTGARVKWVKRENIHLTLKFLGDIELEKVNEINGIITGSVQDIEPFTLRAKGTGTFPKGGRAPRVVWAGIEGGTGTLETIYNHLNDGLVRFGVPYEKRRFSPHITVGRVKSSKNTSGLVENLENYRDMDFGEVEVTELAFLMSELTSNGPVYTPLSHVRFGG
jgi:2'-5' RNA ligase